MNNIFEELIDCICCCIFDDRKNNNKIKKPKKEKPECDCYKICDCEYSYKTPNLSNSHLLILL